MAAASASVEDDDLLTQLRQLTNDPNLDEETGKFFLEMCAGDLEKAAEFYKEQQPAPAPAPPPAVPSRQTSGTTATGMSTTTTTGLSATRMSMSSGSASASAGSRRRTSTVSAIPKNINATVRRLEPGMSMSMGNSSSHTIGSGAEPGVGLVTGRRNRGFANNVELLGSAAEFEFLNQATTNPYTSPPAPNKTVNVDVYGFSSPGAFHEYQDGSDGMYARERRESAVSNNNNNNRRSSALNPPIEPLLASNHRPVRRVHTGNDAPNKRPSGSLHRQRQDRSNSNSPTPGLISADPRRRAHSPPRNRPSHITSSHSHHNSNHNNSQTRLSTVSALTDYDSMVSSSRLYDDEDADDRKKPAPSRNEGSLDHSDRDWTGRSLLYADSRHRMSTASTLSAFSDEMGVSQSSLMTDDNEFLKDHDQPKKRAPDYHNNHNNHHIDGFDYDDGDLNNDDIIGNSNCSSSSRRRVSTRNYAVEPCSKQIITGQNEDTEMMRIVQRIAMEEDTSMSSLGDDFSDSNLVGLGGKRISHSSSSSGATCTGRRDSSARRVSAAMMTPSEPTITEETEHSGALDTSSAASTDRPDPPGDTINTPWLYDHSNSSINNSSSNNSKSGKAKMTRATRPGAVSMAMNGTSSEPLQGKVKRAPATQPGVVSVVGSAATEPQHGKGRRLTQATRPGAVNVSVTEVQEPGTLSPSSPSPREAVMDIDDINQNSLSSIPVPPLLPLSQKQQGKARRTTPATRPGAVSVPASDEDLTSHHDSSNNNMSLGDSTSSMQDEPDRKIRRAPTSRPGAVSVMASAEPSSGNNPPRQKASVGVHTADSAKADPDCGKGLRRTNATVPGAVSVSADDNQEEPRSFQHSKVRHRGASQPGAVSVPGGTSNEDQQETKSGARGLRKTSRPGAVSVNADNQQTQETAKEGKLSGLRRGKVKPGATSVSGTSEQDEAEQTKTGKFRLGQKPGVVRVVSKTSTDDSSKTSDKDGKKTEENWKVKKPGAVSVTSSEDDSNYFDRQSPTPDTEEPAMDPDGIMVSEVGVDSDDVIPTAGTNEAKEVPSASAPLPPIAPSRPPQRRTNAPTKRVASRPDALLPNAPLPTPGNRGKTDAGASTKKEKKGMIRRIFSRGKHKQPADKAEENMDSFDPDNPMLRRSGTGRTYPGR